MSNNLKEGKCFSDTTTTEENVKIGPMLYYSKDHYHSSD